MEVTQNCRRYWRNRQKKTLPPMICQENKHREGASLKFHPMESTKELSDFGTLRKSEMADCVHPFRNFAALTFVLVGIGQMIFQVQAVFAPESTYDVCFAGVVCDHCPSINDRAACDSIYGEEKRWYDSLHSCLSDNGITTSVNVTQFYFGTVNGGFDQTDRYGAAL